MKYFLFVIICVIGACDKVHLQSAPQPSASSSPSSSTKLLQTQPIYPSSDNSQYQGSSYPVYSGPNTPYSSQSGQYVQSQNVPYGDNGFYPPATSEIKFPEAAEETDGQPYSNAQVLENPSYDPELYQNFVPQDAVQQYISQYGGSYSPAGESGIGYPVPYGGGFQGAGGFPGPGGFPNPSGFALQSGYEGFLVPAIPPPPPPPGFLDIIGSMFPYPRTLTSMFMRSGSWIFSALSALIFGGAVTTAVCTLTPLCTISFAALPLIGLRGTAQKITEKIGTEITKERMAKALEFVKTALDKYEAMQEQFVKNEQPQKNDIKETSIAKVEKKDKIKNK